MGYYGTHVFNEDRRTIPEVTDDKQNEMFRVNVGVCIKRNSNTRGDDFCC